MNQTQIDERWMRLALTLGQRGMGMAWPNPAVGCVIVNADRVVGRGWTQPGGRPHAEVYALAQAGKGAIGATAYVTLEPCAHIGKTGPCAQALIDAGITRVVSATQDPNPSVEGKGHEMLRKAGVSVSEDVLNLASQAAHAGFFSRIQKNRPVVTLKLASTLDGRIATNTGESRWITGTEARRRVHMLRANHDAVLIGRETALADNPDLTVRGLGLPDRSPVRVVLDSSLRLPANGRLADSAQQIPVWICHGPEVASNAISAWQAKGGTSLPCSTDPHGTLDLESVLNTLAKRGITRLFVEGGGKIAASLLSAGYVDRLILFSAGVVVGGDGRSSVASLGIENLSDAPRFRRISMETAGADIMSEWEPTHT